MSNVGESDEPRLIKTLLTLKERRIPSIGVISSVADYRGIEFSTDISIDRIPKAPIRAKRDVTINGIGYSLKSKRASPPAIVNHTTREKWCRIASNLGISIEHLDRMVGEYWELREKGIIGEDVRRNNPNCPFGRTNSDKQYLNRLITYFLFDGSGASDSQYPADKILEFESPTNFNTWTVIERERAFEELWSTMIFSLRAKKGMPTNYPNMRDGGRKRLIEPWVRFIDGNYRGALHIRSG